MDSIRGGEFELSNTNKLAYWYPRLHRAQDRLYLDLALLLVRDRRAHQRRGAYIAVVMHCETSDSRNKDAETLLDYAFSSFRLCPLNDGSPLPDVHVELGRAENVRASTRATALPLSPRAANRNINSNCAAVCRLRCVKATGSER